MKIKGLLYKEFDECFPVVNHVFNKAAFNNLNKDKVEQVKYLIFSEDNKNKIGIIGGVKNDTFSSPFSAPFGGWSSINKIELQDVENACEALEMYLVDTGIKKIKITLPPFFL